MYIMNLYLLVDRIAELERLRKDAEREANRLYSIATAHSVEASRLVRDFDYQKLTVVRGAIPQKVVANRADVAQSLISRIEGGDIRNVSLETLQRILQVYAEI